MIAGLFEILLFQGFGELVSRFALPLVPGPVIGLLALLGWLKLRGSVGADLEMVAGAFSRHLGVLFVPAAVGVVMFLPQLKQNALAVAVALIGSVVLTIAVSALLLKWLGGKNTDAP